MILTSLVLLDMALKAVADQAQHLSERS